jgi:hypothetical protein
VRLWPYLTFVRAEGGLILVEAVLAGIAWFLLHVANSLWVLSRPAALGGLALGAAVLGWVLAATTVLIALLFLPLLLVRLASWTDITESGVELCSPFGRHDVPWSDVERLEGRALLAGTAYRLKLGVPLNAPRSIRRALILGLNTYRGLSTIGWRRGKDDKVGNLARSTIGLRYQGPDAS